MGLAYLYVHPSACCFVHTPNLKTKGCRKTITGLKFERSPEQVIGVPFSGYSSG